MNKHSYTYLYIVPYNQGSIPEKDKRDIQIQAL